MTAELNGYNGCILHVNLSTGKWEVEKPSEHWYRTYLGGGAMASYYLLKELKPKIDPLSEDNILIFASNVVSGVPISGMSRYTVAALSPLTGAYGESEAGGWWGPELKFAGYDGIVVSGRSDKSVYLWIHDGDVEIRSALSLWGLDNGETRSQILQELGDPKIKIASIGPAGENQVRFACVINELRHVNGRTGMGAVMGSKNLKAIAVRGKGHLKFSDPERVKEISQWLNSRMHSEPVFQMMRRLGTAGAVTALNQLGMLPTRNFRESMFEGANKIGGEMMADTILKGQESCFACALRCKRVVSCSEPYTVDPNFGGPEYETLAALGSYCGIDDLPAIAKGHELCNRLGLDTISTGVLIGFAMECFEEGILKEKDIGRKSLRFGDTEAMLSLIQEISQRKGLGDVLSQGVRSAAEKIGHGAQEFALHVKGQETAMHDPRGKVGLSLSYALSAVGVDHNEALPDHRMQAAGPMFDMSAPLGILEPMDVLSLGPDKVRAFTIFQRVWNLYNALGVCIFTAAPATPGLTFPRLVEAVKAVTGWDTSLWELLRVGERANVMARIFNIRRGIGAEEDRIFRRMHEPVKEGPFKGKSIDPIALRDAIRLYYDMNGWDNQGKPTQGKLVDLGLEWLVQ